MAGRKNDLMATFEDKRTMLMNNLDTVFAEYIRKRDGYACVLTGEQRNLSIHHVLGQAEYPNTRWDEHNAFVLANRLHRQYHEANPFLFMDWYVEKFGLIEFVELRKRAEGRIHIYSVQELIEITNQYVKKTQTLPKARMGNGVIR